MNRKTPTNITKWEAGQELIKAHDQLLESAHELREQYPELSKMLRVMGLEIGTHFNAFGSHNFGLADLKDLEDK